MGITLPINWHRCMLIGIVIHIAVCTDNVGGNLRYTITKAKLFWSCIWTTNEPIFFRHSFLRICTYSPRTQIDAFQRSWRPSEVDEIKIDWSGINFRYTPDSKNNFRLIRMSFNREKMFISEMHQLETADPVSRIFLWNWLFHLIVSAEDG